MELLGLIAVVFLFVVINSWIEKHRQKTRDRAARETLKNFDFGLERQEIERTFKGFMNRITLSRCPKCKSTFKIKENPKEIIWACSEYPKCDYVKGRVSNGVL